MFLLTAIASESVNCNLWKIVIGAWITYAGIKLINRWMK